MKKRLLAWVMALALAVTLLPAQALAQTGDAVSLDLGDGSIVITETGYTQGSAAEETAFTGSYVIRKAYTEVTTNTIQVKSGDIAITLADDINIDVSATSGACAFAIESGATVNLTLSSEAVLKSGSGCAGLQVPTGASLTIQADSKYDSLEAIGGSGAGIGGNSGVACGNLTIESGRITATGGTGAGIGGGFKANGTGADETIYISGGTVTAKATSGAGIGGGSNRMDGTGDGGMIVLGGNANVTAISTMGGAGIGGGRGYCTGTSSSNRYPGGDGTGTDGQIVITDQVVVQATGTGGAGIGGGGGAYYSTTTSSSGGAGTGTNGQIMISGQAQVNAVSVGDSHGNFGAGIGSGDYGANKVYGTGTDGQILIKDTANVTAAGKIGVGGYYGTGERGKLTISGDPTVTATGSAYAGIGGYYATDVNGAINISGGTIVASVSSGRGIGGTSVSTGGAVNITGGDITATGYYGMGAANLYGGVLTVKATYASAESGFSVAPNTSGSSGPWIFAEPACPELSQGVAFSGTEGVIYGDFFLMKEDREIPAGYILTVAVGQELVVMDGTTLTVNGKLIVEGTLTVKEGGQIIYGEDCEIVGNVPHDHDLTFTAAKDATCDQAGCLDHWTCSFCGKTFSDAQGNQEATRSAVTLPAFGHDFDGDTCGTCGMVVTDSAVLIPVVSGRPGDTVEVPVSLANNPGIITAKIDITYDTTRLELMEVTDSGLLAGGVFDDTLTSPCTLTWEDGQSEEDNSANGVIATLTFRVLEDCETGTAPVTAEVTQMKSAQLGEVVFGVVNGAVNVLEYYPGDANGDGVANLMDATLMRRFIAHWEGVTIDEVAADLNGDGAVELDDVVILRRFIAHWEGYDLPYENPVMASLMTLSEDGPVVTISDGVGLPGELVTVEVSLEDNPGVIAVLMELDYDTEKLRLVDAQDCQVLPQAVFSDNVETAPFRLTWEDGGAKADTTANDTVARLTFEVLENCDQAEVSVRVGEAFNQSLMPVSFSIESGTIFADAQVSYDEETGEVSVTGLPDGIHAYASAYLDDRMVWFTSDFSHPLDVPADTLKVFFLNKDWEPVGSCREIELSN